MNGITPEQEAKYRLSIVSSNDLGKAIREIYEHGFRDGWKEANSEAVKEIGKNYVPR